MKISRGRSGRGDPSAFCFARTVPQAVPLGWAKASPRSLVIDELDWQKTYRKMLAEPSFDYTCCLGKAQSQSGFDVNVNPLLFVTPMSLFMHCRRLGAYSHPSFLIPHRNLHTTWSHIWLAARGWVDGHGYAPRWDYLKAPFKVSKSTCLPTADFQEGSPSNIN